MLGALRTWNRATQVWRCFVRLRHSRFPSQGTRRNPFILGIFSCVYIHDSYYNNCYGWINLQNLSDQSRQPFRTMPEVAPTSNLAITAWLCSVRLRRSQFLLLGKDHQLGSTEPELFPNIQVFWFHTITFVDSHNSASFFFRTNRFQSSDLQFWLQNTVVREAE